MTRSRTIAVVLTTLVIGFGAGFVMRPVIAPVDQQVSIASAPITDAPFAPKGVRGTQYFTAHIDEARRIVAGCRDGSVRGGECATAEEAIIKVEAQERRRRFLDN